MERPYWRSSAWGGKAPRKKRRSSPLPGELPTAGRSGAAQCRRRLFGSVRRGEPQPGCPKGKCAVKTLPKIKENLEVTQGSPSSNQSYSTQVNVKEMPFLGKNEEDVEGSTVLLKESPVINFESKESLKNTDVTSGTGMTLPTGVSDFLLECLDADSSADRDTVATDTTESFPSPETLRDEERSGASNPDFEDFVKCKNSTLLDCSRAVAIDKILQISNLSPILEPVLEDCKDQCIKRKRPKCNYSSSELSVSTTVAGKKICKITTARERTPALKSGTCCSSPVGAERKPDSRTAEPKRLKSIRKEELSDLLEGNASPCGRLESAPAEASAKSVKVTTEVLPSGQTDDAVTWCYRKEICSIVRTSPARRPYRHRRLPVKTKAFCLPEGVPEDVITSSKNWICCKHR
ncbi:meiosis-specific kinetochore protein isoform X1 [Centrocercus urophasianus]|uniref:meiosis-specific kinetochore protein isoform X1 n=1 Tax=Centrocercus urophasianus TaxID=9002 RepID=UPI001C64F18C|nr:meiosis-specific kinetochore protein isoform X1 [Centrocercus urophasianus]